MNYFTLLFLSPLFFLLLVIACYTSGKFLYVRIKSMYIYFPNTDKNDFRKLSKLKCLDISNRDYLIVKLMEQYRKNLDKETVKEEFFKKVCRRYDLKVEDKQSNNDKVSNSNNKKISRIKIINK